MTFQCPPQAALGKGRGLRESEVRGTGTYSPFSGRPVRKWPGMSAVSKIQEGPGPGLQRKRKDQTHGAWVGYQGTGGRRQKGDKEPPPPSEPAASTGPGSVRQETRALHSG